MGEGRYPLALGGLLSFVGMAVHSLGDFNLQMPATAWLLGAIIAVSVGEILGGDRSIQT